MRKNSAVVFNGLLLILSLGLSGCDDGGAAVNNISDLVVRFNEDTQSYTLRWQAEDEQQAVDIAVATGNQPYRVLAKDIKGNNFHFQVGQRDTRYQFKITPDKGRAAEAATRWLPLEGGKNFRDLGGYLTSDGHQLRWGKLFRSGALSNLSDRDYQLLDELDIATVVDFRNTQERQAEPTQWQGEGTEILSWEGSVDMQAFGHIFMQPNLSAKTVEQAMASAYPQMTQSLDAHYTAMFDRLASDDAGMIFHCTAGKDRTGIAAALILSALGVDRQTVIDDFMLSDVYYTQMVDGDAALGKMPDSGEVAKGPHNAAAEMFAQLPPDVIAPLLSVRESYITAALESMEQQSGSVLAFIQQELDVTDEELARIRQHYLQPVTVVK